MNRNAMMIMWLYGCWLFRRGGTSSPFFKWTPSTNSNISSCHHALSAKTHHCATFKVSPHVDLVFKRTVILSAVTPSMTSWSSALMTRACSGRRSTTTATRTGASRVAIGSTSSTCTAKTFTTWCRYRRVCFSFHHHFSSARQDMMRWLIQDWLFEFLMDQCL